MVIPNEQMGPVHIPVHSADVGLPELRGRLESAVDADLRLALPSPRREISFRMSMAVPR